MEVTLQNSNCIIRQMFEGLFEHFFSPHRHSHSTDNCMYFLKLINMNTQWNYQSGITSASVHESLITTPPMTRHISLSSAPEDQDGVKGCIPMSVYKYYLSIILDKADTSNVGTAAMTSLVLYKPWVRPTICLFVTLLS